MQKVQYKNKISSELESYRLDVALSILNNDLTRSTIKKVIDDNQVKVNGQVEYRRNYKVRVNDLIEFELIKDASRFDHIKPQDIDIEIVYEDEDLVAVNKKPGMVVHPASGNWENTLMNSLVNRYKDLNDVGDRIRSGLIHRLDKDTSGIILVGKTNKALWHYSRMFEKRQVEKIYLAICYGKLNKELIGKDKFYQEGYLARNPENRIKMIHLNMDSQDLPSDSRISKTYFEILAQSQGYFLIRAYPKTGRTHQIRVHLQSLGIPIVGDQLYGDKKYPRMYLHAYQISIKNPRNEELKLVAPLSDEFLGVIRNLFNVDSLEICM